MVRSRPTTLTGLLWRAVRLRPSMALGALAFGALVSIALVRVPGCESVPPNVATFNIENYPRSDKQVEGAFEAIRATGAAALAVQEITDPTGFCTKAQEKLGPTWACAFTDRPSQRVGIIHDSSILSRLSVVIHHETETYDGAKPALEVRFDPILGGRVIRMLAVHLKAGGDGGATRRRQLGALYPALQVAVASGEHVVLLGDFNATGSEDVEYLAHYAKALGLHFVSENVPCTAFWNRRDGCLGQALDHVLSSVPADVTARGPCESTGCELRPSCPTFHKEVSDHCPVVVEFSGR